jgi:hypothetical protein
MIYLFLQTFFTPLPYKIYNDSTANGNMAYAGVGLGLIRAQNAFWLSVCTGIVAFSMWNSSVYFPLQYALGFISVFLLANSVILCNKMLEYFSK